MTDACECSAVNAPGETQYPLSKALFQKYDRGNSHYAVGNPPGVIPTLTKVVRSHALLRALLRVGTACRYCVDTDLRKEYYHSTLL